MMKRFKFEPEKVCLCGSFTENNFRGICIISNPYTYHGTQQIKEKHIKVWGIGCYCFIALSIACLLLRVQTLVLDEIDKEIEGSMWVFFGRNILSV